MEVCQDICAGTKNGKKNQQRIKREDRLITQTGFFRFELAYWEGSILNFALKDFAK